MCDSNGKDSDISGNCTQPIGYPPHPRGINSIGGSETAPVMSVTFHPSTGVLRTAPYPPTTEHAQYPSAPYPTAPNSSEEDVQDTPITNPPISSCPNEKSRELSQQNCPISSGGLLPGAPPPYNTPLIQPYIVSQPYGTPQPYGAPVFECQKSGWPQSHQMQPQMVANFNQVGTQSDQSVHNDVKENFSQPNYPIPPGGPPPPGPPPSYNTPLMHPYGAPQPHGAPQSYGTIGVVYQGGWQPTLQTPPQIVVNFDGNHNRQKKVACIVCVLFCLVTIIGLVIIVSTI